jgi:transposase
MICPNCDAEMEEHDDDIGFWTCPECGHEEDRTLLA